MNSLIVCVCNAADVAAVEAEAVASDVVAGDGWMDGDR